jgi:uncharacterized membrane protein YphA (DoxX/SURF4 family)
MKQETRTQLGRLLLLVGRFALAAIFLVAAYAKMRPPGGMPWTIRSIKVSLAMFALGVDSYQMLPPRVVTLVAHLLPPSELFLGLWLLSGIGLRFSSLVSTLTISGFIVAMWSAYERGLTISCGCFGPGEQVGPTTLVRDGLKYLPLALVVTVGAFMKHRKSQATVLP